MGPVIFGRCRECEVHVFEAGAADVEVREIDSAILRPPDERAEESPSRGGAEQHLLSVAARDRLLHLGRHLAEFSAGWQAEPDLGFGLRTSAERFRCPFFHDPAAGDDRDAVGEVLGLLHLVRGQEHRDAG
jgi:hypothetical protein